MPNPTTKPMRARRAGRKRRIAGVSLFVLGLVVAAIFIASRWWAASWKRATATGSFTVFVNSGVLGVYQAKGPVASRSGWTTWSWPPGYRVLEWRLSTASDRADYEFAFDLGVVFYGSSSVPIAGEPPGRVIKVLLWPIALLACVAGTSMFCWGVRARTLAARAGCPDCGYNLAGLKPAAKCPECGTQQT